MFCGSDPVQGSDVLCLDVLSLSLSLCVCVCVCVCVSGLELSSSATSVTKISENSSFSGLSSAMFQDIFSCLQYSRNPSDIKN